MNISNNEKRLDAEWTVLNAVRDLIKLAADGDRSKSTYNKALDLGAVICPELLGAEVSLLRQDRESDLTKKYRQKAALKSIQEKMIITALSLVQSDIKESEDLLEISTNKDQTDKLRRELKNFYAAEEEINPDKNSENQLIFRDAYKVERNVPILAEGKNNRTFEISDESLLTIRVLHPEIPEHITGADLLYERYDKETNTVVIALVQYKIWEDRKMYFSDERMHGQIDKMRSFLCDKNICQCIGGNQYRFPNCSAFLRPTDKLQTPNQAFISTGEHLPICHLEDCVTQTKRGAFVLDYKDMKKVSLSHDMFEELFNKGKIGSRPLGLHELAEIYKDSSIISKKDRMLLYAQEYPK